MEVSIHGKGIRAVISSYGAELRSLRDEAGVEYIWYADPTYWNRSSPVLFPIVGNLKDGKTVIGGRKFAIPKHGFARDSEFELVAQDESSCEFELKSSDKTRAMYPYDFSLRLRFIAGDQTLETVYTVANLGEDAIYYCLGAHPGFLCDGGDIERYELEFEQNETADCPLFDTKANIVHTGRTTRMLDNSRVLPLRYAAFDNDALIFEQLKSHSVTLRNGARREGGEGRRDVRVRFDGFQTLGVWTPSDKKSPFICLEPWNGMPFRDDESGEFIDKPQIIRLEKGDAGKHRLVFSLI